MCIRDRIKINHTLDKRGKLKAIQLANIPQELEYLSREYAGQSYFNYHGLTPIVIGAIQASNQKITKIGKEIKDLEEVIASIKAQVEAIQKSRQ